MRILIAIFLMLFSVVHAAEVTGAQAELLQARAALDAGNFRKVFQHTARVEVFYYRDAEAVAEALYYEVLANRKTGGARPKVSALTELKTLYPESPWCQKAVEEFEKGKME